MGIGQIGKAFRNEITPGNFTFRTIEFEQMEYQTFCKEGMDEELYAILRSGGIASYNGRRRYRLFQLICNFVLKKQFICFRMLVATNPVLFGALIF